MDGRILTSPSEIKQEAVAHFQSFLNELNPPSPEGEGSKILKVKQLWQLIQSQGGLSQGTCKEVVVSLRFGSSLILTMEPSVEAGNRIEITLIQSQGGLSQGTCKVRGGGELEIRIKPDPDNGTICRSRKPN
ncbi:hypothetical protein F2Q69_00024286 [Brassica cretica]|uniref:Uncharacterized protein n=1 Tax=Brassica cretica TaxID=69181 RepID=A0A8S9PZ44_BRACR|nr:hypothetical protein F2Q69_00024286 [Brassica cretica]